MLFLHFSDIHFKKTEVGQPDDPNKALRSDIIEDVKRMRKEIQLSVDGIWLTGDIAFAGDPEEYAFAYQWLEETLCPVAGCKIEDVFVIPGNHDVDRRVEGGPAPVMVRQALRNEQADRLDAEISRWMRDRLSSNLIFGPIESYNRFAAKFLCPLRAYIDDTGTSDVPARPFATRDLKLNDGSILRLWGFNTVLVSDITDAENRMLVDPAAAQIPHEDGVCHVVMAHHPFSWIKNRRAFEDRCNAIAKVQLFGHEHTRRVEEARRYLRIRAGAMHPDRDQPEWKPGYNWIEVSVDKVAEQRKLKVRLWVRQYEVDNFLAIPDPEGNTVWENSYDLPQWSPPEAPKADVKTGEAKVPVLEPQTMPPTAPPSIRSVTIKFFKLKEHEQRRLISQMKLDKLGDRDLKDYELVIAAVKRSDEQGLLPELDRLIDKTLAGGTL
jgi:predicted phosphodiesterase